MREGNTAGGGFFGGGARDFFSGLHETWPPVFHPAFFSEPHPCKILG